MTTKPPTPRSQGLGAGLNGWGKGSRKHCKTDAERRAWDQGYKEGVEFARSRKYEQPHKKGRRR